MISRIQKQAKWWKYAAGTIPMLCLCIITIIDLTGWSHLHNKLLGFLLLSFLAVGVFWWWWAVDQLIELSRTLFNTEKKFAELKEELKKIKNEVKLIDSNQNT